MSHRRPSDRPALLAPKIVKPKSHGHELALWSMAFIACAAGLVLAVALFMGSGVAAPLGTPAPVALSTSVPTDGFTYGQPGAPVTIDLYEDFQCPICREWYATIFPQLRDNQVKAGTVKLVFHGFAFIGPESSAAERAAYAAAAQGRFWDMWATLYTNQGTENSGAFSDARLRTMAAQLGLNMSRYDSDFASSAAAAWVSTGEADAASHNVTGTPTMIIAGTAYSGVGSYADLSAAIAAAAAR
jgi:protein-disulfide isomerase